MSNSPLSEAKPESLMELFQRDPLELTRTDRDVIVRQLRIHRARFEKEEAAGVKQNGRKKKIEAPADLSLKDLGI